MRLLPSDPLKRARAKLVLLGLFFAAPFALAWLAWWLDWAPGATSNYGELVEPRLLTGAPFEQLRGKWVLVSLDASVCGAYCERKLYFMRQLRRAQGRNQARVERLWLLTDGRRPADALRAAIEGTHIEHAPALVARFPAAGAVADHIYVVDPLGNLMMRYPRDPDPSRMLKDLQRLLKVSGLG